MVDPNTRQGKRTPVTLKIKFKSETIEQFIERYAVDVSQGGIFIRTKEPLAVGTQMRFEFQLKDASPLIAGEGTVVWTRENDPSRPAIAPGMGVRFDRLAEGSQTVLERILAEKAKQAPQRTGETTTKPPLFTDTPTKVAPLPVQEALLGGPKRAGESSFSDQGTPLPKPMPFHSDAEDFDEQAFEEATKVRALDELIAQTAEGGGLANPNTAIIPPDELAARRVAAARADSTLADGGGAAAPFGGLPIGTGPIGVSKSGATVVPVDERDSAPGLPSPPATGARLLDTSPSPKTIAAPGDGRAVDSATGSEPVKTKLGLEAPRSQSPSTPPKTQTPPAGSPSARIPVATPSASIPTVRPPSATPVPARDAPSRPMAPAPKSSAVPVVILILVLLAAGAAGVWFFYLRPKAEEEAAAKQAATQPPTPGSGSAVVEAGSGSAGPGSDAPGSAGSAVVEAPKGPVVDTVITSSVDKSTVEIVGTDQKGPAPFTAKLEKDKDYKARVSAPGFAALEVDVKGGAPQQQAKLVAKPRIISVASNPDGALIFVDGQATGAVTPHDVELTKAQAAKKSVRITVRKQGFRNVDKVIALDAYKEEDARLVAAIDEKLAVQQVVRPPPPQNPGSATTPPPGGGSGSATPPEPANGSGTTPTPTPTPPTPTPGSATPPPTPTPTPTTGSAAPKEPEPDFTKPQ